jgi:hypothetical protein
MANIRIELPELGDGFWVSIKHPNRLSWKEQKAITGAYGDGDVAAQLGVAERVAIAMIKEGYVLDDDNKPIQFPLTAETIDAVPAVVIEKATKAFADAKKEATGKNS